MASYVYVIIYHDPEDDTYHVVKVFPNRPAADAYAARDDFMYVVEAEMGDG